MFRAFYEKEEDIPADMKQHYAKPDGETVWVLQVDGGEGWSVENVSGLRSTLSKLKDRATKAERMVKEFEALGVPVDDAKKALEDYEKLKANAGKTESERITALQTELETVRKQAAVERDKEIAPLRKSLDGRTAQLRNLLVDATLDTAISAAGGNATLLRPALRGMIRVDEDEQGNLLPVVIDRDGTPRVTGKELAPMTIEALVGEAKSLPDFAVAFSATDASGGGTPPSRKQSGGPLTPEQISSMPMAEYRKARADGRIT
jgi:hypothetical protein